MAPEMYRVTVPPSPAASTILVGSGEYRRRVSVMYRRRVLTVGGVAVTPELFIYTKESVQPGLGGIGIHVLPNMQFQVELDRGDRLLAIADANSAFSPEVGIETSVVIEALELGTGSEAGEKS